MCVAPASNGDKHLPRGGRNKEAAMYLAGSGRIRVPVVIGRPWDKIVVRVDLGSCEPGHIGEIDNRSIGRQECHADRGEIMDGASLFVGMPSHPKGQLAPRV